MEGAIKDCSVPFLLGIRERPSKEPLFECSPHFTNTILILTEWLLIDPSRGKSTVVFYGPIQGSCYDLNSYVPPSAPRNSGGSVMLQSIRRRVHSMISVPAPSLTATRQAYDGGSATGFHRDATCFLNVSPTLNLTHEVSDEVPGVDCS